MHKAFPIVFLLVIVNINFIICKNEEWYSSLIMNYFDDRSIHSIVIFMCMLSIDKIKLLKEFSQNNMIVAFPQMKYMESSDYINNLFNTYSNHVGIVFDSSCFKLTPSIFLKNFPFDIPHVWLILNSMEDISKYVTKLKLSVNTDLIVADTRNPLRGVGLFEIYHTGQDREGELNMAYIGQSNGTNEWKRIVMEPKVRRRNDLKGIIMRTTTFTEKNINNIDTHTYLMDDRQTHLDTPFKMNYQLIRLLQNLYNFTIKFVLANNWSDKNSNGLYQSGNMLGILRDKRADIMAAGLLLKDDRLAITDTLYMTYPLRCGFIFRYTGDFGDVRMAFYSPFTKYVWYSFLLTMFLVTISAWFILSIENKYINNVTRPMWNFSDTVLSVIGACCQMGSEIVPATSASRVIHFIFFFASVVIYNFYTSSIVSSLLNARKQSFDIRDLADSPLTCGSMDIGYFHNLLFDVPIYINMDYFNKKKKTDSFYYPLDIGLDKVKRGRFAYHAEMNTLYKLVEYSFDVKETCELLEVDTIPREMLSILAMKHSPYSEMFKTGLNKIAEVGLLNRLTLKWISKKPMCESNAIFIEVGLNQISASYIPLYLGVILSIILISLEMVKKNQSHKAAKNKILLKINFTS